MRKAQDAKEKFQNENAKIAEHCQPQIKKLH